MSIFLKSCLVCTAIGVPTMVWAVLNDTCNREEAVRIGGSLKIWNYVTLFVPATLAIVALVLATSVAWFSIFVYWRQLIAVEKLARQMMDMAMSASLPEQVLEKAAQMYGPKDALMTSASKSRSGDSKMLITAKSLSESGKTKDATAKSTTLKKTSGSVSLKSKKK